jgi:alpha-tubulin suppressor-like RCC1 family protein
MLRGSWGLSRAATESVLSPSHTCRRKTSFPSLQARVTGAASLFVFECGFFLRIDDGDSVCLNANGELFTWGGNTCGELGRAEGDGLGFPQLVPTLMGTRISQVTHRALRITGHTSRITSHVTQIGCGGAFSIALSEHGVTYAWGR